MISKERLEELIEQEATIWAVYDEDRMEQIKLIVRMMGVSVDEYNKLHDCEPMLYSQFCGVFRDICPISWLFETKEDAEWHKEFGCIERTERLELPTWEEDVCKDILFSALGGTRYIFMKKIKTGYSIEKENPYIIRIQKIGECDNFIDYEYTKENYTLACRKAKELFLGGGDGDIR